MRKMPKPRLQRDAGKVRQLYSRIAPRLNGRRSIKRFVSAAIIDGRHVEFPKQAIGESNYYGSSADRPQPGKQGVSVDGDAVSPLFQARHDLDVQSAPMCGRYGP